jgi:hypothetical protein
MIYLVDDNQHNQREKHYNINFLEDIDNRRYITSIEKIERPSSLSDISHIKHLENASCILLHTTTEDYDKEKGFLSGSTTNSTLIKEVICQEGDKIPLVLFSNSMGEAVFDFDENPNYISSIKKNLFYERLFDFLEYYKSTGKIEMRIIAWGKNFISKEISNLAFKILSSIEQKAKNETLYISDLSNVLNFFGLFIEKALPQMNINEILIALEDNPIKIQDFKRKVNQITESYSKYGKNIYSW